MSTSIGKLYETNIPDETDVADIQAAFRLYHYGSLAYDPGGQSPDAILPTSIAGIFKRVEQAIQEIEPGLSIALLGDTKGSILTLKAGDDLGPAALEPGPTGSVLTVDPNNEFGVVWQEPLITPTSNTTFQNKTLDLPLIESTGVRFLAEAAGNNFYTTLLAPISPTENKVVSLPDATTTLVGRNTTDTLLNKTLSLTNNTISGTVAQFDTALTNANFLTTLNVVTIEQGGTGAANAINAKINLDIFRNATGAFSGKVFVQATQPTSGAAVGDLWFW
jgi:hypothetical protein